MKNYKNLASFLLLIFFISIFSISSFAQKKIDTSKLIYVPAYSSIYFGDKNRELDLAVTLTLRNIDSNSSVTVYSIDYYDKTGNLIRGFLNNPVVLKAYETVNFIVKESDTRGGSSPFFLIKWEPGKSKNDLLAEAVMIGTYPQGITFTIRGVNIKK